MKAIAFVAVLSMVLLSTAAFSGGPATQAGRTEVSTLTLANDPVSRGSKAAVPGLINYQGTLTDTNGVALNTPVSMTFTIYTDSTGGSAVWTETQPIVVVHNGLFNVLLGRVNAIPDMVFQDPERWLGVQVESEPELEPRQRVAAVGYAFRASEADTADFARAPAPSDGDWTISGNHMYSAVPGSVCIGAMIPDAKLHVVGGNVAVSDAGSETGIKIAESWIADPYDGALHIQSGGDVVAFDGDDAVGIGTSAPSAKLDVSGDINTDSLYKIGGSVVLSSPGGNLRVGIDAGANEISPFLSTLVGYQAGYNNDASYCTSVGYKAGYSNEGPYNTFVGTEAGVSHTIRGDNTFVGFGAGQADTSGYDNTFIGSHAGYNNISGERNTFLGSYAGIGNTTGYDNTFLGQRAGLGNSTGDGNTCVGYGAGEYNNGQYNTFLGTVAGYNTLGSSNVFIGFQAGFYETGSNKLYIANYSDTSNVLIYGDFSTGRVGIGMLAPAYRLDVDDATGTAAHFRTTHNSTAAFGCYAEADPGANTDSKGVYAVCDPADYYGDGVYALGGYRGVYGECIHAATGHTAYGVYGHASGGTTNYGVYYSGGLGGSGSKSAVVRTKEGPKAVYCQESPENWFEDFGTGTLYGGRAQVQLADDFRQTVTIDGKYPMKVFITPNAPIGSQWWVEKSTTEFTLVAPEAPDGSQFDYRVVAKRRGFEDVRLEPAPAAYSDRFLYPDVSEVPLEYRDEWLKSASADEQSK